MLILGIETSCDETAAAVVEDGVHVKSSIIASSKKFFERKTGVIPEEAARKQVECMIPVLEAALKDATIDPSALDAIAVTRGPGLLGSLLVGTTTARLLASTWKKPLIGVHHTLGHLSSTWLEAQDAPAFPILTLSASGGHTDLWLRTSHMSGMLLGATRDDAAGEAFDKGASLLGLPYPGGPSIAKAAESGNPHAYTFPIPLAQEDTLDFSYSGLKTSLKYLLRDLKGEGILADLAASYQHAICAHLADRFARALGKHPEAKELHVVGGVSANTVLREMLRTLPRPFRAPVKLSYCTDNAAMIASAGYFLQKEHGKRAFAPFTTEASLPRSAVLQQTTRVTGE
ncbi:tRNA (adenosine(37)-N6)-threonylcarbamoyltransferase complex transferase subunit TsaD [Candidatus Peregrinibacteria bacterium]|nr:tRNA (adenosine(37)-N6)-threonylcarbamoyltransferase complex transferase subunit TsaD [Candidatus Peregrinibacteria bacterium]